MTELKKKWKKHLNFPLVRNRLIILGGQKMALVKGH